MTLGFDITVSNCALNNNDIVADLDEEACPARNKQQWVSTQFSQFDPNAVMHVKRLCYFHVGRRNCDRGTALTAGLQDQPAYHYSTQGSLC